MDGNTSTCSVQRRVRVGVGGKLFHVEGMICPRDQQQDTSGQFGDGKPPSCPCLVCWL